MCLKLSSLRCDILTSWFLFIHRNGDHHAARQKIQLAYDHMKVCKWQIDIDIVARIYNCLGTAQDWLGQYCTALYTFIEGLSILPNDRTLISAFNNLRARLVAGQFVLLAGGWYEGEFTGLVARRFSADGMEGGVVP